MNERRDREWSARRAPFPHPRAEERGPRAGGDTRRERKTRRERAARAHRLCTRHERLATVDGDRLNRSHLEERLHLCCADARSARDLSGGEDLRKKPGMEHAKVKAKGLPTRPGTTPAARG